ncbi:MAG: ComEC/Rec2 family competence protein [Muribaculaceae bacterium]|nr:ComEC/Rec2 family competence protein [Muribaculaceae bacterium]
MNLRFLCLLLGLVSGILLADFLSSGLIVGALFTGFSLIIWLIIFLLSKNPVLSKKLNPYHVVWITLLFAGAGSFLFQFTSLPSYSSRIKEENLFYSGKIEDIKYLAEGDRFKIKILSIRDSSNNNIPFSHLNIILNTNGFSASKGDIIEFEGKVREFSSSQYAERMHHQGVVGIANCKVDKIRKTGSSLSLSNIFDKFRTHIIIKIEKSTLNYPTSEFLISLLLGDKTYLSSNTRETLTAAGLAHILALSGMHVAIMASILLTVLFPLSLAGWHKTRRILVIILIWAYVLLTGGAPSTVRAAIMATFLLISFLLQRKNSAINALFVSVFIIILIDPYSIWDIGLQLSFVCVASIILFVSRLNPIERHKHPNTFNIINALIVTLVATFATWTLVAYYFGYIPLMFLPANLILLPFIPLFIIISLIYVCLLLFSLDLSFISFTLDKIYEFFLYASDLFSYSGNSVIDIKINSGTVTLWLGALIFFSVAFYSTKLIRKRILTFSGIGLTLLSFVSIITYNPQDKNSIKFLYSFSNLNIQHTSGNVSTKISFPRDNISKTLLRDVEIIAIDNVVHPDSLSKLNKNSEAAHSFLIVGPKANITQVASLIDTSDYSKVILHSSVGEKKKVELLNLINESQWEKIHSLRDRGSLELDLDFGL